PARERQHAGEAARIGTEVAVPGRTGDVERGYRDDRPPALRQQDPAAAGKRSDFRPARRLVIEARRIWVEQQPHALDSHRLVRTVEQDVQLRPLAMAVADKLQRAVLPLLAPRLDMEGAVLEPDARPRQ